MSVVLASVAFWAPVKYLIVGDDGQPEVITARARFRRLKSSEQEQLNAQLGAGVMTDTQRPERPARLDDPHVKLSPKIRRLREAELAADPIGDDEFLNLLLVDWELKDKRGERIPFTSAALAEVCEEWDGFEGALVRSYFQARRSALDIEAVEKNLQVPSATGG